jgi:hypothetical protein
LIIQARTAFAIRCPHCGKMETASFSWFDLGGGRSVKIACSCGTHKLTVGKKGGQIWLQAPCYLCESIHFLYYPVSQFLNESLGHLACGETDLHLGIYGDPETVESHIRHGGTELDLLLHDGSFAEYFDRPDVMYQVLSCVHSLGEDGKLTCTCGNREITLDIYPERLELTCESCGREMTVPACSEEDLLLMQRARRIQLGTDQGRYGGQKK